MKEDRRTAIIGAGPAGAACAIQLKREGFSPLLFEKDRVGGTLRLANAIDNIPFVNAGTSGAALAETIENNLAEFGIGIIRNEIAEIEKNESEFILHSTCGQKYTADFVVIACGLAHTKPELPQWTAKFICGNSTIENDGDVLIIGGGDVAIDRALSWKSRNAGRRVCVLNRSDKWKALPVLLEKAKQSGIEFRQGNLNNFFPLKEGFASAGEESVFLHLAVHVGREEQLPSIKINGNKEKISVRKDCCETQIGGLFLVGDARHVSIRHAGIAASDGMLAAIEISSRLGNME